MTKKVDLVFNTADDLFINPIKLMFISDCGVTLKALLETEELMYCKGKEGFTHNYFR
ncbi:MAG: hypothetical protein RIF39_07130 [Cyclobacteriaceae bacterium]